MDMFALAALRSRSAAECFLSLNSVVGLTGSTCSYARQRQLHATGFADTGDGSVFAFALSPAVPLEIL